MNAFYKNALLAVLVLTFAGLISNSIAQNVGVNSTGAAPDASAMLDVSSTTTGFLVPRMTLAQRTAIGGAVTSLLIYQTDNSPGFYYYLASSGVWLPIGNRPVTGTVDDLGNIIAGSGFSVTNVSVGVDDITFSTAMPTLPALVVTSKSAPAPPPGSYCAADADCGVGDMIDNLWTTGGITNISNLFTGCFTLPPSYVNYSPQNVSAFAGGSFDLNMQCGPIWEQGFGVWIDWNQDGDFTDPGEDVYFSPGWGFGVFTTTVNVPITAVNGTTRMRIRCDYWTVPALPCGPNISPWGEIEDYDMIVVGGGPPLPAMTVCNVSNVTTTGFRCNCTDLNGTALDTEYHFNAAINF